MSRGSGMEIARVDLEEEMGYIGEEGSIITIIYTLSIRETKRLKG